MVKSLFMMELKNSLKRKSSSVMENRRNSMQSSLRLDIAHESMRSLQAYLPRHTTQMERRHPADGRQPCLGYISADITSRQPERCAKSRSRRSKLARTLQEKEHRNISVRRNKMIARMWHGRVPTDKATAYREFLNARAIPDYRSTDGNLSVYILER